MTMIIYPHTYFFSPLLLIALKHAEKNKLPWISLCESSVDLWMTSQTTFVQSDLFLLSGIGAWEHITKMRFKPYKKMQVGQS